MLHVSDRARTRVEAPRSRPQIFSRAKEKFRRHNQDRHAIATAAHTPRPVVTKLHDELVRYFTSPETVKLLAGMGIVLEIKTAAEMRKIIPEEIAKWTKVAIEAGMPRNVK